MGSQKEGFFTVKDDVCYTGSHLFLELWGIKHLSFPEDIKKSLIPAVKSAKATLIEIKPHHFLLNNSISGIAILSKYKKFYRNLKYYNLKIHYCSFTLANFIMN